VGFFVLKSFNSIFICSLTKKEFKMKNFVKKTDDNVIVYVNGVGTIVDTADSNFFTIDIATEEWGLPASGWDKENYLGVAADLEIPADYPDTSYKLVGSDGNWSIEAVV
jgi:hypothetical protein